MVSEKKGEERIFLGSLKLLWNPSLRGKCQQWQEKNLMGVAFFSCDEERRGIVSELSESVHDEVWASFLGQHALYLFSVSFLFCLFVCLSVFGDVNILHTINKINLLRLLRVELGFLFKTYINSKRKLEQFVAVITWFREQFVMVLVIGLRGVQFGL